MSVSGTREKLVEVARELFAKMGMDNITMNDIAKASNRGRRTLYTYFKSKTDIYDAIVESEFDLLNRELHKVCMECKPADEKLIDFLFIRLRMLQEVVTRNGTLRASFFRDIWRVEMVRKSFDVTETQMIHQILSEGVEANIFEIQDVEKTAFLLHYMFKGLEVPFIRGIMSENDDKLLNREDISIILFNGLKGINLNAQNE